jgi:hypothetical protein
MAHSNIPRPAPNLKPLLCARCGQPIQRSDPVTLFLEKIPWTHIEANAITSACKLAAPPIYVPPSQRKGASCA